MAQSSFLWWLRIKIKKKGPRTWDLNSLTRRLIAACTMLPWSRSIPSSSACHGPHKPRRQENKTQRSGRIYVHPFFFFFFSFHVLFFPARPLAQHASTHQSKRLLFPPAESQTTRSPRSGKKTYHSNNTVKQKMLQQFFWNAYSVNHRKILSAGTRTSKKNRL